MTFIPFADKIEIEPIEKDSAFLSPDTTYEEMGKVISVGSAVTFVKPGDTVFFLRHAVWETPAVDGTKHFVVTESPEYILGKVEAAHVVQE